MKKTIRLYIGKRDISEGIQCNTSRCPIALAAQRYFDNQRVWVSASGSIKFKNREKMIIYTCISDRALKFVNMFDAGGWELLPTKITFKLQK